MKNIINVIMVGLTFGVMVGVLIFDDTKLNNQSNGTNLVTQTTNIVTNDPNGLYGSVTNITNAYISLFNCNPDIKLRLSSLCGYETTNFLTITNCPIVRVGRVLIPFLSKEQFDMLTNHYYFTNETVYFYYDR